MLRQGWIPCPDCGSPMHLKRGREREDGSMFYYGCSKWPACDGQHSAHANGEPMGIPAPRAVRIMRTQAHELLKQVAGQSKYYSDRWKKLHLRSGHIGMAQEEELAKFIKAMEIELAYRHHQEAKLQAGKMSTGATGQPESN